MKVIFKEDLNRKHEQQSTQRKLVIEGSAELLIQYLRHVEVFFWSQSHAQSPLHYELKDFLHNSCNKYQMNTVSIH